MNYVIYLFLRLNLTLQIVKEARKIVGGVTWERKASRNPLKGLFHLSKVYFLFKNLCLSMSHN